MGSDFDRIKPPQRRLLERPGGLRPEADGGDPAGRAALFSAGDRAAGDRERLAVTLGCARCGATTSLDAPTALRAACPMFLVLPWRSHPLFARCPACRYRAWLRPRVAGAPGRPGRNRA